MSNMDTILREADRMATITSNAPNLLRARDIAVPAAMNGQNIFDSPFEVDEIEDGAVEGDAKNRME